MLRPGKIAHLPFPLVFPTALRDQENIFYSQPDRDFTPNLKDTCCRTLQKGGNHRIQRDTSAA